MVRMSAERFGKMLGDRWSLPIICDMMLQGARTYKTFLECYEGIATNILADLRKLTKPPESFSAGMLGFAAKTASDNLDEGQ